MSVIVFARLRARMAELGAEHRANVEARARVIRGSDWSELPALKRQSRAIGYEIKEIYDALMADKPPKVA